MSHKLSEQIAEVRREIEKRKEVYPRHYGQPGWPRKSEADYKIDVLESVVRTLELVHRHQDAIREIVKVKGS